MSEVRETKTSVTYYRRTLPPVMVIFPPRPVSQSFRKAGSWPDSYSTEREWQSASSETLQLDSGPSSEMQLWWPFRLLAKNQSEDPAMILLEAQPASPNKTQFHISIHQQSSVGFNLFITKMLILQIHLILMYSSYSSLYSIMFLNMRFHLK